MGLLQSRNHGRFLAGRSAILIGIIALHAVTLMAMAKAGVRQKLVTTSAPIEVILLREPHSSPPPPPMLPRLADIKPVELVLPEFALPEAPAATAITVTAHNPSSAPAPAVAVTDAPVVVDSVEYVRPPKPRYPPAAKKARVQGLVMLRVLIDLDGRPSEIRIHRSSGSPQLDAAAKESVMEARFRPYRENGVARTAQVLIPIEFTLTIRTASRG